LGAIVNYQLKALPEITMKSKFQIMRIQASKPLAAEAKQCAKK